MLSKEQLLKVNLVLQPDNGLNDKPITIDSEVAYPVLSYKRAGIRVGYVIDTRIISNSQIREYKIKGNSNAVWKKAKELVVL